MNAAASASFPWSAIPEPAAGRKRFDWLRLDGEAGRVALPCLAARGRFPGPAIVILAGLEQPNQLARAAALQLADALDPGRLHGSLLLALPDGVLLPHALPFPGAADGDRAQRLAHAFALNIIAPADALIELRSPLSLEVNGGTAVHYRTGSTSIDKQAADVARMLGPRVALAAQTPATPTTAAAWMASMERTAVLIQLPDASQAAFGRPGDLFGGLVNGLRAADAFEGLSPGSGTTSLSLAGLVIAPVAGFWESALRIGQQVRVGDELGLLSDAFGAELGRTVASDSGAVVSYVSADWVERGAPLAVLGR